MNTKDKYRELCKNEESITVFSTDWWLDAVCGKENWDVAIVEQNNEIIASLPFENVVKVGYRISRLPMFTQKLGPWIKYPDGLSHSKKISFEKKILSELIESLAHLQWFVQAFDYSITNWLPFYWNGFKQFTKYTYLIENISNVENVFNNFDYSKQKNIRKAEKVVKIGFDISADEFYKHHKKSLEKEEQKIKYSFSEFNKIYQACYKNNAGRTIFCYDKNDDIHSAIFFIWDNESAYNLVSTIDPDFKKSGSASLLIYEIIKFVSSKTKSFDFCGSMIEGVEQSFRRFGAKQIPYFQLSKVNSPIIKLLLFLRGVL